MAPNELCPRVGFIVTNLAGLAERAAEQWTKEDKGAIKMNAPVMAHLRHQCSAPSAPCAGPQSRQLHADADDAKAAESWSLTTLREKLIKIGAKVVSHGRYAMFQTAEIAVPRHMFREILMLIAQLRAPPAPA
jgi:hypothetical protein